MFGVGVSVEGNNDYFENPRLQCKESEDAGVQSSTSSSDDSKRGWEVGSTRRGISNNNPGHWKFTSAKSLPAVSGSLRCSYNGFI